MGRDTSGLKTQETLSQHFNHLLPSSSVQWMTGSRPPTDVGFRVHQLRASTQEVIDSLSEEALNITPIAGRWDAFSVPYSQRTALTHSPLCEAGKVYVMNPSSMLAVEALNPLPGEEILDLAAAPGGKSLLIADRLQNEGRLACVEPVKGRFFRLKENLKRGGVQVAQLYLADGTQVGRKVPKRFDRVLLDAPCSSEARIRLNEPKTWAHWSPRKVKEASRKQRKLLLSALASVRVGGRVVYSTCSLSPAENEGVISEALRRFDGDIDVIDHKLTDVPSQAGLVEWEKLSIDSRCSKALRVTPDGLFDGFFLCVLERRS